MTPSRRLFVASLFVAPAVIAVDRLMPVKLFRPDPPELFPDLFLQCGYSEDFATACSSLGLDVQDEIRKAVFADRPDLEPFPICFSIMEDEKRNYAEQVAVDSYKRWSWRAADRWREAPLYKEGIKKSNVHAEARLVMGHMSMLAGKLF